MKSRLSTTSVIFATFVATSAPAQVADQQATQKPSRLLIDVVAATPRIPRGQRNPTIMLRVSSVTGEPVPFAIPFGKTNWTAYSAQGNVCRGDWLASEGLPWYSQDGVVNGPIGITAGVKAPAVVPITIKCDGFDRGDEMTLNIVFFALVNNRAIPQQFTFSRLVIS